MWRVFFLRMFGYRTLASRANLGCIDVAKLPSRQSYVSWPVNPHFYMCSSSVEDLSQYSVAQVRETDFSMCRLLACHVVCVFVSTHVLMSYPGLEHLGRIDVANLPS